jgi:AP-1-like factor
MSGFQSANPLWDFTLPTDALTTLPDDDFLAILQSQIANTNGVVDPTSFFIPQQSNQDIPLSANPKTLTRLPEPSANASPLTDSSPSPPSGQDGTPPESITNRRGSVHSRRNTQDDALKRKANHDDEDDEDDGAPPTNKSHTGKLSDAPRIRDSSTLISSLAQSKASKRKSGGNASPDEVRLMKRKEQNRAAQRAFRERKEKHVKDVRTLARA